MISEVVLSWEDSSLTGPSVCLGTASLWLWQRSHVFEGIHVVTLFQNESRADALRKNSRALLKEDDTMPICIYSAHVRLYFGALSS